MKRELMMTVMQQMTPYLDNARLKQLRQVMEKTLFYIIINTQTVSVYFKKHCKKRRDQHGTDRKSGSFGTAA